MRIVTCDRCAHPMTPGDLDWYRMALSPGWRFRPDNGYDLCPDCAKTIAEANDWITL